MKKINITTLSKMVRAMMKEERRYKAYDPSLIFENPDACDNQGISKEELLNRMGLTSWEEIKKRLNGQRPLDRDFLIALFSQLQLSVKTTNYALNIAELPLLYSGEDPNDKNPTINKRDRLIIAKLNESVKELVSINEINQSLSRQGSSPLRIRGRKAVDYQCDYYVIETKLKVDYEEAKLGMYESSLERLYDVDLYPIVASSLVKHNDQEDYFIFKAYNDECSLFQCSENGTITSFIKNYKSIEDADLSLRPIFNDLKNLLAIEKKKILTQFDDTKNYGVRTSAKYISGSIHVFAEKFDFSIPERNEYFFLDYHDGQYDFSISNKSQFYYCHLGDNKYKSIFRHYDSKILYSSHDKDEIKSYLEYTCGLNGSKILSTKRIDSFNNLILETEKLINRLKDGIIFIRDINYLFEEPEIDYNVCSYYNIQDKFDFYLMDKNAPIDFYLPGVQESTFVFEGKEVLINLDDVRKAFSYGLSTIDDICLVKIKYGSIENLINNL